MFDNSIKGDLSRALLKSYENKKICFNKAKEILYNQKKRFSFDVYSKEILEVYNEILNKRI